MNKKSIISILILFFIGFFVSYFFFPREKIKTEIKYVEKIKIDTIVIEKNKFIKIKGRIDTLYLREHPEYEDYFVGYQDDKILVSTADTSIVDDKINLSIKYLFEPNLFDIQYHIKQNEIIKTLEIKQEPKLFLGTGLGLSMNKDFKIEPSFSIGLYYNLKSIK